MMKTKEELHALKNEVEALNKKLAELSEEEVGKVVAGIAPGRVYWEKNTVVKKSNNSGAKIQHAKVEIIHKEEPDNNN